MAGKSTKKDEPKDWDKALSVAYLRLCKVPQVDVAKRVGVGLRTVGRWENSSWWIEACRQASNRWLGGLVALAQQTVYNAVKEGDAQIAFKIVERQIAELAPPRQGYDVAHSGEIATPTTEMSDADLLERAAQLTNRMGVLPEPSANGSGG